MKVEMSKTKQILCLISIFLTSIAVMADLVIIPFIGNLYGAFPDQMAAVNYIVSGPMLIIVIASLLAPFLIKMFGKKTVIVTGGIIFAIGAIFGVTIESAVYMAVMRTLVGIGIGLVNVVAVALIADIYEDEVTRAKIVGYYNAALTFTAIPFSYFSGIIAETSTWQNSFLLYLSAIPMVIMLILFIPSIKTEEPILKKSDKTISDDNSKQPLGLKYWVLAISWLIMNILFGATVLYYVHPYLVETEAGSNVLAGIITSGKSVLGFLVCLAFGLIYAKLTKYTNTVVCLVAALSIFILVYAPSQLTAVVFIILGGIAYKIAFSYAYARGFAIVPKSRADDVTAITTAAYGLGSFLSTYYATWLLQVMNTDMFSKTWVVSAVIFVIFAVIEVVVNFKDKDSFKTTITPETVTPPVPKK